ncbi:MAG: ATP-dependent DNA helicase [Clostridiales bacterium]|jgi:Rad3-related DNA helicase|nr:ATP-dependent DNA helicase [Clostridiales bacterium]
MIEKESENAPIEIKMSVRSIVEFILRQGSIDSGFISASRAVEGTRLHQSIQKRRKKEAAKLGRTYESEKKLAISLPYKEFIFNIEGRADGVETFNNAFILIEEIKSTLKPVSAMENRPDHWHWAQAKCYGYICCLQSLTANIEIQLTYGNLETEETVEFKQPFSFAELEAFFMELIEKYWEFAKMDADRLKERSDTAKLLPFPFSKYRPGQRELCISIFTAIKKKKKLFAQAPTGIGKTASALYPSIKALAEGFGEKIFYCTAKTITRQVAEETLLLMQSQGLRMRAATITAKDKICFLETRSCTPEDCEYALDHFNRVNGAILDIITNETIMTRAVIESYAKKHRVCPFEFSLDATLFSDAIICDYNHVYDPKASLKRFFADGGEYILLTDEAHNLADRARDMFSATISKSDFASAREAFGKKSDLYKITGKISKMIQSFTQLHKPCEGAKAFSAKAQPDALIGVLKEFASLAGETLQKTPSDELMNLYFSAMDFLRISDLYDSRYVTFIELGEKGFASIKLYCLDPSALLSKVESLCRCSIFFSATLTPLNYFRGILGGGEEDYLLKLRSPFPQSNLCLMVDRRISTKYKDRAESVMPIANILHEMASSRKGNYLAFFPSYEYLKSVVDAVNESYPELRTLVQSTEMDEESRRAFLESFAPESRETLLGFAVLGGLFSEGIDLKADRLIGAAIVGVGLPLICPQRDVIADYYSSSGENGFDYAYVFPGMNKVLQAAGRVIRSETDQGVVLLIDSRFSRPDYRRLFPPEWSHAKELRGSDSISAIVRAFWDAPLDGDE